MRDALVGVTGFVGGNLAQNHEFEGLYHSRNIEDAFGTRPELLVYAGVRAEKYLANTDPSADMALVEQAFENIRRIAPQRLVLISTVDVYGRPAGVDEDTPIETEGLHPYGLDRYRLEQMVRDAWPDALIVRLPGLFGRGLKKNLIHDLLTPVPSMLREDKYRELCGKSPLVAGAYLPARTGFLQLRQLPAAEQAALRGFFEGNSWNALSFTDSRAVYQFYDLSRLWADLKIALDAGLTLLNLATEPVAAAEICRAALERGFVNELPGAPVRYDMRTLHAGLLGGRDGYLADREQVLAGVRAFIKEQRRLMETAT